MADVISRPQRFEPKVKAYTLPKIKLMVLFEMAVPF